MTKCDPVHSYFEKFHDPICDVIVHLKVYFKYFYITSGTVCAANYGMLGL